MAIHPALAGRSCYHKYEVEPGLFTPGHDIQIDPKFCLDELGVPRDLAGTRALDIGAWDGPYSFELERRGAEVTALDIQDPDITVFNAVKEIKKSSVTYARGSVYDATPETLGNYHLILFAGVYYHLKNPVLALQRIRRLLKNGGVLFIEGASGTDHLAEVLSKTSGLGKLRKDRIAEVVDRLPLAYFDAEHRIYAHWSNWWFPTTRCLEALLLDSGFHNVDLKLTASAFINYSGRRLMGRAEADPEKSDPEAQRYEHALATRAFGPTAEDKKTERFSGSRFGRLLSWLPTALHPTARRMLRAVRRSRYSYPSFLSR